jgi:hypothetical protein
VVPYDLQFSPDGTVMATGRDDCNAYLYAVSDPEHPRLLARLAPGPS